jgi:hypothetical protein
MKLTIVAAVLLGAALILPGSALAANFETANESGSTIVSGNQTTENVLSFPQIKSGMVTITCSTGAFSGTMEGTSVEELTLHPVYNKEV